jgi:HSP20 family protein
MGLSFKTSLPAILQREFNHSPFLSFDTLFEEALKSFPNIGPQTLSVLSRQSYPKVDILDQPDNVLLIAAVPGLTKKDLSVEIEDGTLTISGNKQKVLDTEDGDSGFLKRELHRSSFRRSWLLSENLDQEAIEASVKDGLLTVKLPKLTPEVRTKKKIKIK